MIFLRVSNKQNHIFFPQFSKTLKLLQLYKYKNPRLVVINKVNNPPHNFHNQQIKKLHYLQFHLMFVFVVLLRVCDCINPSSIFQIFLFIVKANIKINNKMQKIKNDNDSYIGRYLSENIWWLLGK